MANISQSHFRFGKDDGTESGHTFWQLEDVNHTQLITADWTFLLRFCEQVTTACSNVDAQFQYNKNGAGWVDITTVSAIVKAVPVNAFTDAQACTKRLSGTGTFESSGQGCTEDGLSGGAQNDIVLNGNSETEAGLQVVASAVANGDTIQFRLTSPDGTMVYTITPTLTIQKAVFEYGIVTLSGLGTLAGMGGRIRTGISTLVGAGATTAIGSRIRGISATLSGVGLVATIGTVIEGTVYEYGSAILSGAGTLVASGVRTFKGAATLTGSGLLATSWKRIRSGTASIQGAGSLSTIGYLAGEGCKATLSGIGTLAVKALRIYRGVLVAGKIRRHYTPDTPPS